MIVKNDMRKMLLATKRDLLQQLKFYDKKIALERRKNEETPQFEENYENSDSDPGFQTQSDLYHQTVSQLENERIHWSICLQATQELTGLVIIEWEQEVLVEAPELETSDKPSEPGNWWSLMAECRVDRVHFTMTCYVHLPHRQFAPPSYHGMRVKIIKSAHEKELEGSVLRKAKRPSDVVQLLKSYGAALRSRRNTLSALNDRFGDRITLELAPSGGFLLKCANILQLTWTLECNKSILANFQHVITSELEYIEPHYLKLITATYNKLREPSLRTDDRTSLVADIVSRCLEIAGIDESSAQETDVDRSDIQIRSPGVMAPPLQPPKRVRERSTHEGERKRKGEEKSGEAEKDVAKENQKTVKTNDNKKKVPQKEVVIQQKQDIGLTEVPAKKAKALKDKSNIVKNILANNLEKENENVKNVEKKQTKNVGKGKQTIKNVDEENSQAKEVDNVPKEVTDTEKNKTKKIIDTEKNKDPKQKDFVKMVDKAKSQTKKVENEPKKVTDTEKNKTNKVIDTEKKKDTKQREVLKIVDKAKSLAKKVGNEPNNAGDKQKTVMDIEKNKTKKNDDIEKNKDSKKEAGMKSSKDIVNTKSSDIKTKNNIDQENNDKNKQILEKTTKNKINEENKLTSQKATNIENKNDKKSLPNQKTQSITSIQTEKPIKIASTQNKPQVDATKSVATTKNTDQTKKPATNQNKITEQAKKNKILKLTDKNTQSKDAIPVSKIPKPLHTKIPVKIPNKNRSSKELTPKSQNKILKPKLKNQNKLHLNTKPVLSITKAVEHHMALTSTPINAARLAKKSAMKEI